MSKESPPIGCVLVLLLGLIALAAFRVYIIAHFIRKFW